MADVGENLKAFASHLLALENSRQAAYAGRQVATELPALRGETAKLVNALKTPATRGRWGELQLRRVVEIAGMQGHCDFAQQPTADGDEHLRPDMVVTLPGGETVVVDAKAPLQAYLAAIEEPHDERRKALLTDPELVERGPVESDPNDHHCMAARFNPRERREEPYEVPPARRWQAVRGSARS